MKTPPPVIVQPINSHVESKSFIQYRTEFLEYNMCLLLLTIALENVCQKISFVIESQIARRERMKDIAMA